MYLFGPVLENLEGKNHKKQLIRNLLQRHKQNLKLPYQENKEGVLAH